MYSNKFVVCLLVNGRPQKEKANGTVIIPFGTEYSIRFRNKHNRRAVVKFSVDGEDVSGNGYIVDANGYVDIHRHAEIDRAFKFVSLDSEEAVDFGKNGPNHDKVKGLIEAHFYLEKEYPKYVNTNIHHHHHWPKPRPPYNPYNPFWYSGAIYGSSNITGTSASSISSSVCRGLSSDTGSLNVNTDSICANNAVDGCTVEGGATGQNFFGAYIDTEDTCTTIKLFLQGTAKATRAKPKKVAKKRKSKKLRDIEKENEELELRIAELHRERLLKELELLEGKA